MDHFELVSEYAPPATSPRPSLTWSKASRKVTSVRPSLASPVRVKLSRWQMSSSKFSSPSVPGPENGEYLVLFGADLSIFCGGNRTR